MYHAYYLYIPAGAIWLLWLIWKFIFSTKNNSGKQIFLSSIFYMYIVLVLGITLFPIPIDVSQTQSIISFIPLKTVMPLFSLDSSPFIQYILSTLVLFIPFGLLTPFFLKKSRTFKNYPIHGFICSHNRSFAIFYRGICSKFNIHKYFYWWYFI